MASVTLSQNTQNLINTALSQGTGTNNANYIAAYNAIYNDIKNSDLNTGTLNWFSEAANVDGYQYNPNPTGAYIWNYTLAAAASEGYTVLTTQLQIASNRIAAQVFQNLQNDSYVLSDTNTPGQFAPQQIIADDAGAGITYLQGLYPNLDYAVWGGTLYAETALNDPTYIQDYKLSLTPGSTDCNAITAGASAGLDAAIGSLLSGGNWHDPTQLENAFWGYWNLDASILAQCNASQPLYLNGVQYGANGNVESINDGNGGTVAYSYNSSGQATAATADTSSYTFTAEYNPSTGVMTSLAASWTGGDTATVTLGSGSIAQVGTGAGTLLIGGTGDEVNASDATVTGEDGASFAVDGYSNDVYLSNDNTLSFTGGYGNWAGGQAGDTITIGGNGQWGNDDFVNLISGTLVLEANAAANLTGGNDMITLGQDDTVGV